MSEIKIPPRKGLQIVKKGVSKKENKMQCENTQNSQSTKQSSENSPSQGKTKIKIISFLGMTKTCKDVEDFQAKSEEEITTKGLKEPKQAQYTLTSDFYKVFEVEKDTIKLDMWSATECLLKEFNKDNFDFTLYGTKLSNKKQSPIYGDKITPKEFDQKEYSKFLGDLINDLKNDFSSNKYKKIIIDITHGFRDNTILAIFAGLIQANINKDFKINFIVAKEIIQQQEYEFISLDEYIENMVMSNVLSTFKQCLKVPDYNLDNPLYLALKGFSDALFKNQIQDIILNLQNLEKQISDIQKTSYIYPLIKDIKDTLYDLSSCKITTNKDNKIEPTKEIYYELSRLYHKHNYALNSSQFLLEAMYFYMFKEFEQVRQTQNIKYSYNELEKIKKFINDFASADTLALNYEDEKNKKKLTDGIFYVNFVDSFPNDIQLLNDYVKFRINVSKLRNVMSHCDAYKQDKDNNYLEQISKLKKEYKKLNQKSLTNEFKSALKIYLNSSRKTHTGLMHLLFSHELSKEQEQDAKNSLKVSKFKKLPSDLQELFSNVPADNKSITQVAQIFQDYLKKEAKNGDYVLISGDFGLVYQLVSFCKNRDLKPVYATTKREVLKDENGIKQSVFKHIRFREF